MVYRHVPQVQGRFVQYLCRVAGVVIAPAVHQDTTPDIPGGHQQAERNVLAAAEVLIGLDEGHILQQMGTKMLVLLLGQLDNLGHLHTDRPVSPAVFQILHTAGLETEMGINRRFRQVLTSMWVS